MPSGKWWPWVVALALAAATAAVLIIAGTLAVTAPISPSPTDILAWSTAVVTLGGAALGAFRWASENTYDPSAQVAEDRIYKARRFLAVAVEEQWKNEARYRDWEKRPLIQVHWRAPVDPSVPTHAGAVKNAPQTASSAEIVELAEKFRACEPRRLVILGGPGMGKTTLAVRLLLELLATRAGRDEPVPVILPVAQWDTDRYPRLQPWLTEQLYDDYPGLRWLGVNGVRQMVDLGHVLPILDGLDELPEPAQATVIERLNASLGTHDQLILTSRTAEYTDAAGGSRSGRGLDLAAVLEPLPVTWHAAVTYLKCSLQSHQANQLEWVRALEVLRTEPASALAEAAATPLGLWLLRAVYIKGDGDPAELTDPMRFPTPDILRAHLFDHLIGAFLPSAGDKDNARSLGLSRAYQADDVKRWLASLAHHLTNQPSQHDPKHLGTRGFEWWRLASATGRILSPCKTGLVVGIAAELTIVFMYVLMFVLSGGPTIMLPAEAMSEVNSGLTESISDVFMDVLAIGLAVGPVAGLTAGFRALRLADDSPGYADFRLPSDSETVKSKIIAGLRFGLMAGFTVGLAAGLTIILTVTLTAMRASEPGAELTEVLGAGIVTGLSAGLSAGLVAWLIGWIETPSAVAQAITPQASLHADRTLNLARIVWGWLISGLVFGLVFALVFAPGFANRLGIVSVSGLLSRLMFGLAVGLPAGLVFGLACGRHRAWLAYVWASWRLSREGVLPRKLMPFLDDMHRLGLLRAVGRIYQFRHAELQDHLAAAYRRAG